VPFYALGLGKNDLLKDSFCVKRAGPHDTLTIKKKGYADNSGCYFWPGVAAAGLICWVWLGGPAVHTKISRNTSYLITWQTSEVTC